MALIVTFLGLLAAMVYAPATPAGRFLHHALVALPARGLARIARGNTIVAVATIAAIAGAFWWIDEELALVMTLMAPEALAYLAMFEIGTLVDALLAVTLVVGSVRFRQIAVILRKIRPRAAASRARRPQRPAPSNDDEDGAGYALAA